MNGRELDKRQENIVKEHGLFPHEWNVIQESDDYIYIVEKNGMREIKVIQKVGVI